jgi:hypothetical protein
MQSGKVYAVVIVATSTPSPTPGRVAFPEDTATKLSYFFST